LESSDISPTQWKGAALGRTQVSSRLWRGDEPIALLAVLANLDKLSSALLPNVLASTLESPM
jgi:hypothetical protein